ncbi:hypothetical protein FQR65_LT16483 [Abscondita terminalis]|nr:hypothetical protein FQR65_LT16483 [Abscondita terminalis]
MLFPCERASFPWEAKPRPRERMRKGKSPFCRPEFVFKMEGEQFSLCWNNFNNNLRNGFHTLLKDEDLVDVTLAAEGHYVKAHKVVLSICSPYLKELFRANPGDHPIVILPDVNYSALQSLLEFMYKGEVSVSQDEIPAFMKVAETLKVKGLTESDNGSSVASPDNTNGLSNSTRNSPFRFGNSETNILKQTKPAKKIIKPIQQLRLSESPKTAKSSPRSTSPHQRRTKRQCIKPDGMSDKLVDLKKEPTDEDDNEEYDENLDMSQMLDTTISEPGRSSGNWLPDYKLAADTSSPGTLQCVLGKRGNPRLIVDGHTFFKKSTYKGKSFWYCKHSRTPYRCQAVCWTLNGHIVKWPSNHSHVVVPEPFNPEEDMEVMKDIADLEALESQAKRQRVKNILSVEIKKLQTEMNKLQIEALKPQKTRLVTSKRYQTKLNNYAWDQSTKFVKFYVTLKNVQNIPVENVTCHFTSNSLELKVKDLENKDYLFSINKLLMNINPNLSNWKIKTDTVLVNVAKLEQKHWDFVTEIEKRASEAKKLPTPDSDKSADPSEGLMNLMKNMYDQGDDEMKRTIAKALHDSRSKGGAF